MPSLPTVLSLQFPISFLTDAGSQDQAHSMLCVAQPLVQGYCVLPPNANSALNSAAPHFLESIHPFWSKLLT